MNPKERRCHTCDAVIDEYRGYTKIEVRGDGAGRLLDAVYYFCCYCWIRQEKRMDW